MAQLYFGGLAGGSGGGGVAGQALRNFDSMGARDQANEQFKETTKFNYAEAKRQDALSRWEKEQFYASEKGRQENSLAETALKYDSATAVGAGHDRARVSVADLQTQAGRSDAEQRAINAGVAREGDARTLRFKQAKNYDDTLSSLIAQGVTASTPQDSRLAAESIASQGNEGIGFSPLTQKAYENQWEGDYIRKGSTKWAPHTDDEGKSVLLLTTIDDRDGTTIYKTEDGAQTKDPNSNLQLYSPAQAGKIMQTYHQGNVNPSDMNEGLISESIQNAVDAGAPIPSVGRGASNNPTVPNNNYEQPRAGDTPMPAVPAAQPSSRTVDLSQNEVAPDAAPVAPIEASLYTAETGLTPPTRAQILKMSEDSGFSPQIAQLTLENEAAIKLGNPGLIISTGAVLAKAYSESPNINANDSSNGRLPEDEPPEGASSEFAANYGEQAAGDVSAAVRAVAGGVETRDAALRRIHQRYGPPVAKQMEAMLGEESAASTTNTLANEQPKGAPVIQQVQSAGQAAVQKARGIWDRVTAAREPAEQSTQQDRDAVELQKQSSLFEGPAIQPLKSHDNRYNSLMAGLSKQGGRTEEEIRLAGQGQMISTNPQVGARQQQEIKYLQEQELDKRAGVYYKDADGKTVRRAWTDADTQEKRFVGNSVVGITKLMESGFEGVDKAAVYGLKKGLAKRGIDLDSPADAPKFAALMSQTYQQSPEVMQKYAAEVGAPNTDVSSWAPDKQQQLFKRLASDLSAPGFLTQMIKRWKRSSYRMDQRNLRGGNPAQPSINSDKQMPELGINVGLGG